MSHFVRGSVRSSKAGVLTNRARTSPFRVAHPTDVRESESRTARAIATDANVDSSEENCVISGMQTFSSVVIVLVLTEVSQGHFCVLIDAEAIPVH